MLHATALGLSDDATASLAKEHLADLATIIMRISSVLPVVVLTELENEGIPVAPAVASAAERDSQAAWKEGAERSHVGAN
jgi:hypothetical protein